MTDRKKYANKEQSDRKDLTKTKIGQVRMDRKEGGGGVNNKKSS